MSTWQPKADDFQDVIRGQNPWWETGTVPDALARSVRRPLARHLWKRLYADDPHRFQVVLGPRRVGKTTSLYQTVEELLKAGVPKRRLWWLRLDHPLLMRVDLGEMVKAITNTRDGNEPTFLFCDELAYAKDWDLWLKTWYDERWPLRVAASSSSTAALRQRHLESGTGRWEEQYLAPYTFPEFLELVGEGIDIPVGSTLDETVQLAVDGRVLEGPLQKRRQTFLLAGGFPELLIRLRDNREDDASILLESQRMLHSDAVERAVYKDIPQAFNVESPLVLERLLYTLAGQVAGLLSPQNLCQELGMAQPTFDRYLSYLERAFLVFTLPNFAGNESATQRRGRKLYFVDGAVRNAALQRGLRPLTDAGEMGLLLENMVAGHLYSLAQVSQSRLYHWRDRQAEVDLVFDHPEKPMAFEISTRPQHPLGGMRRFIERFPRFKGRCYLISENGTARLAANSEEGIGHLPVDLFLLALGAQVDRELQGRLVRL